MVGSVLANNIFITRDLYSYIVISAEVRRFLVGFFSFWNTCFEKRFSCWMFTDLFANAPMTNVTFFWQKHSNTHQRLNSSPHMPKKDHHTHSTMILQKYTNSDSRVTVMTCLKKITNSRVSCYTQEHLNRSQHYKFWYIPQQSNKISTTHLVQRRYSFSFFFSETIFLLFVCMNV